jgi:hypothetical protein
MAETWNGDRCHLSFPPPLRSTQQRGTRRPLLYAPFVCVCVCFMYGVPAVVLLRCQFGPWLLCIVLHLVERCVSLCT